MTCQLRQICVVVFVVVFVRGSSRRIKIMRFRPANIRLIHRRQNLPRLPRALSSDKHNHKNNNTDLPQLTGHSISEQSRICVAWSRGCEAAFLEEKATSPAGCNPLLNKSSTCRPMPTLKLDPQCNAFAHDTAYCRIHPTPSSMRITSIRGHGTCASPLYPVTVLARPVVCPAGEDV